MASKICALMSIVFLLAPRSVPLVPQEGVAVILVAVSIHEVVLRELKDDCYEAEKLVNNVLVDVAVEAFDLGKMATDRGRVGSSRSRGELEDAIELHIIAEVGESLDGAERSVPTIGARFQVSTVLEFLLHGKREGLVADGELAVDLILGESEVFYIEEACANNNKDDQFWSYFRFVLNGRYDVLPIWCTASFNCAANFSLPPDRSNCERSRVIRSAQSTSRVRMFPVLS